MATNGGAIEKSRPCKLNRDRTERTKITQDYVLDSIFAAMERYKKADSFNAAGVFKGAELLSKPSEWRNGFISRSNVADFLVKQIEDRTFISGAPVLVN
jgi:hypothetical protein